MAFKRVTAKVDLDAIRHNYDAIRQTLPAKVKIMGVIKADAYGHGALPVARELVERGIDMFGVATIEEGISLRKHGVRTPILILGFTAAEDYPALLTFDLAQTVYEPEMAAEINKVAAERGQKAKIHIKVDTGMGRLGFAVSQASADEIKRVAALPFLEMEGLFTHFAKADEADTSYTKEQIREFTAFADKLKAVGVCPREVHTANSAGVLNYPDSYFTMVRAGIILYGSYPSEFTKDSQIALEPALSICSRLIFVKEVPAGRSISYGGIYQTDKPTRIGTVSIGYADGYQRLLSNRGRVLIRGQYAQVLGRVCMDQMMVDLSAVPEAAVGDEVVLFGRQGGQMIPIEEVAELCQTINYEIMCLIGKRVPREYYRNGKYQFEINYFDILEEGLHIEDRGDIRRPEKDSEDIGAEDAKKFL